MGVLRRNRINVGGATHRAAGLSLLRECRALGDCELGRAEVTGTAWLSAPHVVHAVGGCGAAATASATAGKLATPRATALADEHSARLVAVALISAGISGYPVEAAAQVAIIATATC